MSGNDGLLYRVHVNGKVLKPALPLLEAQWWM